MFGNHWLWTCWFCHFKIDSLWFSLFCHLLLFSNDAVVCVVAFFELNIINIGKVHKILHSRLHGWEEYSVMCAVMPYQTDMDYFHTAIWTEMCFSWFLFFMLLHEHICLYCWIIGCTFLNFNCLVSNWFTFWLHNEILFFKSAVFLFIYRNCE